MGKTIFAALYALAVIAVPFFDRGFDQPPTPTEWVQIVIAILGVITVYFVPLVKGHTWIKSGVGAATAGAQVLVTLIDNGVNGNDALMIAFAVAGALGITLAPAESDTGVAVGWGSDLQKNYALAR